MRRLYRSALAWWLWRQVLAGQMLDRNTSGNNLTNKLLQNIFCCTASTTWNPTGGTSMTVTPPFHLRLMGTMGGSNTANNTELTTANGYTAGGVTMGSPSFGTPAAGITLGPPSAVSWTASGSGFTVAGIEVWDTAATALRYLYGTLTGGSVTVNAGNTLQFAASSISASGASW